MGGLNAHTRKKNKKQNNVIPTALSPPGGRWCPRKKKKTNKIITNFRGKSTQGRNQPRLPASTATNPGRPIATDRRRPQIKEKDIKSFINNDLESSFSNDSKEEKKTNAHTRKKRLKS